MIKTIEALPKQCNHAFEEAGKLVIPKKYFSFENVVMAGMGGSGLGARVIESIFAEKLKFPLVRVNDYHLPGFVNEKTLLIVSSYSGNTEEMVEVARSGVARGAKILGIGTGGMLFDLSRKHDFPFYKIVPTHNPSGQPRMAIGYSVVGQMVLASKAGLFDLSKDDLLVAIEAMKKVQQDSVEAEGLVKRMKNKIIAFVGSHHTAGALHVVNNQFNENAKVFTADYAVPELNHHLMEGLKHPKSNRENLFVFMADSDLYNDRIKKRMEVTREVIRKNDVEVNSYKLKGVTKLAQAFELIQFGGYLSYFLAEEYNQDPIPIPWVDYFKKKLSE